MYTSTCSELLIGCGASRQKRLLWNNDSSWKNLTALDNNADHSPDVLWDLMQFPLPFADDAFNEILAYEHTGA